MASPSTNSVIKVLLGEGKIFAIPVGMKDGKPEYRDYHVTPAPFKHVKEFHELIQKFQTITAEPQQEGKFGDDFITTSTRIIQISLERMHGEVQAEEIQKFFSLGVLMEVVKVASDINTFLAAAQDVNLINETVARK